jgi:hypothetical protein
MQYLHCDVQNFGLTFTLLHRYDIWHSILLTQTVAYPYSNMTQFSFSSNYLIFIAEACPFTTLEIYFTVNIGHIAVRQLLSTPSKRFEPIGMLS